MPAGIRDIDDAAEARKAIAIAKRRLAKVKAGCVKLAKFKAQRDRMKKASS